ncbi:MAG TPA: hypothetical protein VK074_13585 [Fodinibius sp.]|nr:hypothetical protein [Fodinibius sp.]
MLNSTVQASAPGKLILIGEYAVLEGAPCLVAAVDRKCIVTVRSLGGDISRITASSAPIPDVQFRVHKNGEIVFLKPLSPVNRKHLRFVLHTLKHVIKQNGNSFSSAAIRIDSSSFYHDKTGHKLGLGASAAVTVSLLKALMAYINSPVAGKDLYLASCPIHREAQGRLGSGTDIAASAAGGIIQYRVAKVDGSINGTIKPVEWPRNLHVIPIWAGYSASTRNMVRRVQAFRNENPSSYNTIMSSMKKLSEKGCRTFRSGDVKGFLNITAEFAERERILGKESQADIVSGAHSAITALVQKAGGVYKPSGAGRGDIGIAFCDSADTRLKIMDAVTNSRFEMLDLAPDGEQRRPAHKQNG